VSATPLIAVTDVTTHYTLPRQSFFRGPRVVKALDGVSFTITAGGTFGLVGESGCGKSTTARLLLLLERATSGRIAFDGADVTAAGPAEERSFRRAVQAVFQDPFGALDPRQRAGDIVGEPLKALTGMSRTERSARVEELLGVVGLPRGSARLYPHEFSGGQRQRLCIARALSTTPKFLVLDEPVSALDVSIRAQILNLLRDLQERFGLTYLFVAHDLAVVEFMSSIVGVMYLGRLVEHAPAASLFARPRHPYTVTLLRGALAKEGRAGDAAAAVLEGEAPNPIARPTGCGFRTRCPFAAAICAEADPPLRTLDDGHLVACHRAEEIDPWRMPASPPLSPSPPNGGRGGRALAIHIAQYSSREDIMHPELTRRTLFKTALATAGAAALPWDSALAAQAKGHVIVAVGVDVATTDPHKITGGADYTLFGNVFESLCGHDLDGNLAPELATAYSIAADGLAYEFTLRRGVAFHNGDPFTAADVVYSWKRAVKPELRNPRASVLAAKIKDIEVVDDHKVRILLKEPDSSFMENLEAFWLMVPAKHTEQVGDEAFARQPIGTGPFKFVSRQIQVKLELEANKAHWGKVPAIDRLTIQIVPDDTTRMAMIRTGEADIVQSVPAFLAQQLAGLPDVAVVKNPTYQSIYFTINPKSPLGDKRVRQAINFAIDRQTMVQRLFFGAATMQAAWCSPGVLGCDPSFKPYPYDPDRARALIKESGLDTSKTYKLVGQAPGRTPQSKEMAEAIGSYLNRVGIKCEVSLVEYGAWLAIVTAREKDFSSHDLLFWTWSEFNPDPMARLLRVMRTGERSSFYNVPALDAKLDAVNAVADPARRAAMIRDIFAYIQDEALMVPLWNLDMIYGVRKRVAWTPRKNDFFPILWKIDTTS